MDGDVVRLQSPGFDGEFEVAPGVKARVEGKVKVIQGIAPGSVAVSWHYGHWAYGASDVEIDGVRIPGDPARGKGLVPNPAMAVDAYLKDVSLTDYIAGDSVFTGTGALGEGWARHHPCASRGLHEHGPPYGPPQPRRPRSCPGGGATGPGGGPPGGGP